MKIILFLTALICGLYESAVAVSTVNIIKANSETEKNLWGLVVIKTLNVGVCAFAIAHTIVC